MESDLIIQFISMCLLGLENNDEIKVRQIEMNTSRIALMIYLGEKSIDFEFISIDLRMNVAFNCFNSNQAIRQQELYKRKKKIQGEQYLVHHHNYEFFYREEKKTRTHRSMKTNEKKRQNQKLTKNMRLSKKQIYLDQSLLTTLLVALETTSIHLEQSNVYSIHRKQQCIYRSKAY